MASSVGSKKPLLYSDQFKTHSHTTSTSTSRSSSICFGSTTPDFGSSADAGGEFAAELARQMAEFMFEEEEEEINDENKKFIIEGPESETQPPAANQGRFRPERRKKLPPTHRQKKQLRNADPKYRPSSRVGSGMHAVFLGGSGSSGTGVFLPRASGLPTGSKEKSGCSMVLMPTRVLRVLEFHFTTLQGGTDEISRLSDKKKKDEQENNGPELATTTHSSSDDLSQLPEDWAY
ncbi:uncharacterized protein LOC127244159 isoform X2 [Andrographis paniculata]|uniref:uncharacterized protein LOC127244159 isoform X2 n=1 Tax=Andrographis paniculata TaxID=175694 RepID=UPI0021E7259E|nr:uncharacterized protein LOC127244159 isoform X2 [Andrographis paniculata]